MANKSILPAEYYRRFGDGWVCVSCGLVYYGPTARHEAKLCCPDTKPRSEYLARLHAPKQVYPKLENPRVPDKWPGEGIKYPDRNGHWRRGKRGSPLQLQVTFHRAFARVYRENKRKNEFIEDVLQDGSRCHSPMQRLAWAFHCHNWEMVKAAAVALAADDTIKKLVRRAAQDMAELQNYLQEFPLDPDETPPDDDISLAELAPDHAPALNPDLSINKLLEEWENDKR